MFSRYFRYLFALILTVTLSVGSVPVFEMPCCDEAKMTEEMPCHGDNTNHHKKMAQKCCLDAFCPKCFSPTMNLGVAVSTQVSEYKNSGFDLYSDVLFGNPIKAPERPPKALG